MSLHLCIQKGAISPKSLHIATSDISQGQNWCFLLKKVQYRLCLCICVFKTVQYRLRRCILLHLIYHKDKPGVEYSERFNIALCLCILLHPMYHKDKTCVVYLKRCSIVLSLLHSAASDMSHGHIVGVVHSKRCNIALCLYILLHPIYHKDKTGVVYSKRCNIAYVFAYSCVWYITRAKLVLCIQNGSVMHLSLHITASYISQGQNWCYVFKTVL